MRTYGFMERVRAIEIGLCAAAGGLVSAILGVGGYETVLSGLRGHENDSARTLMYWLHRDVFVPLGVSIGQSGWEAGMVICRLLPGVLAIGLFAMGFLSVRRTLRYAFPVLLELDAWRQHCPYCLYNLTGNVSGTCPECGRAVPWATAARCPSSAESTDLMAGPPVSPKE